MQTVHRITNGILITYVTPGMTPSTNALLGKALPATQPCPMEKVPAKKVTKRINITRGEPSAHASNKCRFETPLSYEEMKGRTSRRQCKRNDGRKQKTFSRATIRTMYL